MGISWNLWENPKKYIKYLNAITQLGSTQPVTLAWYQMISLTTWQAAETATENMLPAIQAPTDTHRCSHSQSHKFCISACLFGTTTEGMYRMPPPPFSSVGFKKMNVLARTLTHSAFYEKNEFKES